MEVIQYDAHGRWRGGRIGGGAGWGVGGVGGGGEVRGVWVVGWGWELGVGGTIYCECCFGCSWQGRDEKKRRPNPDQMNRALSVRHGQQLQSAMRLGDRELTLDGERGEEQTFDEAVA